MGESEHGLLLGSGGVEKEARERLGGGHGVSSGMPGTQLCAWLPGEDDSARGWAGPAGPRPGRQVSFSLFFSV